MSFLQPALLLALPLAALPVIIHLINQRRYRTVRWAAMMFLAQANRMSRGYARLRQWLIMAARIAALAALIVAVSRPLAGGWLGLAAGGRPDLTIVLLDRSPSMGQTAGGGASKLESGARRLAATLETVGSNRWLLVESGSTDARELESAAELIDAIDAGPVDAPADLPAMLQAAHDAIRDDAPGRAEIWICSDLRRNDWDPESGRWQALREAFLGFPQGVRFHLLAFPETAPDNVGVVVDEARLVEAGDGADLVVSLRLTRERGDPAPREVPVRFEIDGARSEVVVDLTGPVAELKEHRIRLSSGRRRGWGMVAIPADPNPSDNVAWFVFDEPAPRRTVVVAEDPAAARPLRLAASIAPDPTVTASAEAVAPEQLVAVDLNSASLLLWQARLPEGDEGAIVRAFVDRGGVVVFFPPRDPTDGAFAGVRWTSWADGARDVGVETWRGDEDLLARTRGGDPLPVGELRILRACGLEGAVTPLATLRGGAPLLARVASDAGGVYFCATTPAAGDSSLATDGVALYVLVQRAMAAGAEALEGTRRLVAGDAMPGGPAEWARVDGSTGGSLLAGAYRSGDRLLAINRPEAEGTAPVLGDAQVAGLFRGLDFSRVDGSSGGGSLIQEVFRPFLLATMAALIAEAALCMPRPGRRPEATP